ncbi:hypothetical protein MSMEI_6630 [Mycolicibacterium smegmatis MC2 155]|uniref:Uncharacterized protein n=1 Tax=Mycolicibacterium smegmatis (strain ATCC 700084 / mc(2)155) TaxID=246196 RepID=I7GG63_MYCS2|nr:hypothetical protein MSMEI_6630 [Mycolicibacterium smegmatis MC2 155]
MAAHPADRRSGRDPQRRLLCGVHLPADVLHGNPRLQRDGGVSVAVFGGTAPYVATWLADRTGNPIAAAFYVIAAAIVSLATVLTMRETANRPLRAVDDPSLTGASTPT